MKTMRRVGAGTYLLVMSWCVLAWSALILAACQGTPPWGRLGLAGLNVLVSSASGLVGVVFYALSAGRLRDLNFPGWAVKVLALPFFGVLALPVLCFLSGPRWDTPQGPAPAPSGILKITWALLSFAAAVLVSYDALVTYRSTRAALACEAASPGPTACAD